MPIRFGLVDKMTELLYSLDSYRKDFSSVVESADGNAVRLKSSAFYPGGGGQPCDTGTLTWGSEQARVVVVKKDGPDVIHTSEGNVPSPGTEVHGVIDWDRRYALMRTHTALHILCGVIFRDFGSQVTGGNMEPLKARMDFELEQLSADLCRDIETRVNREIEAARPVSVQVIPREEAFAIPDLIRTKINLLPEGITEVRVVNIEGLDLQADGGTHVANTREVGRIRVAGFENKGKINKRLRIVIED
jgi:misacylated tRNA(Ala) deacylase